MEQQVSATKKKGWVARAFNTSVLEKNRLAWVDYLRGIAILLVVYRHVLLGLQRSDMAIPQSLVNANMIFYSFRMPLFFILSGVFIGPSLARKTVGKVINSKFELLLYPYIIWATIQVTMQILLSQYSNTSRTWVDYSYILYDPKLVDQFWYLPALFNSTVVYILIHHLSMMSDWMKFYIFFALGDILSFEFFRERVQNLLKNPWTLAAVIPVFAFTQIYYLGLPQDAYGDVNPWAFLVIALIGCFSMIVLSFRLQSWNVLRFLRVIGFHSLYIYVVHVMVAACVRTVLIKVCHIGNPEVLLVCGIFAGITVPVMFYNLLVKDNILWFLFSPKKPSKERKLMSPELAR
jgi:fucose 4-O-acetylase-like acetyltransferase